LVGRRPGEAEEGRYRATEELVGVGLAALADVERRARPEGASDVAMAAEPAPAEARRRPETRRDRLGRDDVFAGIDPGSDEVAQADRDCGAPVLLVEQAVLDVKGSVVERRSVGEDPRHARIAEGA